MNAQTDCEVDTWNNVSWHCNRRRLLIIAVPTSNVGFQETSSPVPYSIRLHGDPGWRLGVVAQMRTFGDAARTCWDGNGGAYFPHNRGSCVSRTSQSSHNTTNQKIRY